VGSLLISALKSSYRVVGLTRNAVSEGQCPAGDDIIWRQCDLFSMVDAEKALGCADYAFYLVHSMMPSARLTQGRFEDMDLILADNFARAAAIAGVKQIVYLGGLVPGTDKLSPHLKSCLEVEETLGAYGVPVTALRAGLITGANGSTFRILLRLVEEFKVLIVPRWAMSLTHPISLADTIQILIYCLGNRETYNQSFDVGGPEIMTYREMIEKIAEVMGYKRYIFTLPVFSARVAGFLLSLLTGSPRSLVTPLVESMKNPMVATDLRLQKQMGLPGLTFAEAIRTAISEEPGQDEAKLPQKSPKIKGNPVLNVRSVQRLPLPEGKNADWVALHYSAWLPQMFKAIVKVKVDYKGCYFYFRFFPKSLLDLTFSHDRSSKDRPLYVITGGILTRLDAMPRQGRLEFREVLHNRYVLVAIHDYVPTLPWFIYSLTQAWLHVWAIQNFRRHLEKMQ
ncbi:MAG: Rossmann-fold NAD(P)-binding domain-containing protein, partial [Desulfocucumaceae bacterium]